MTKFNFAAESIRVTELRKANHDLRLTTPEKNFGCRGEAREINALYEDAQHNNVVWQPDVYAQARAVADEYEIRRIVDVGCGNGEKLIHYFPEAQFETIGLDFHSSLKLASSIYPEALWVECNLNSRQDLKRAFDEVNENEPVLLILSDVIEHLPDPRLLLAQLRTVLMRNAANRLVLSTPDRSCLGYDSLTAKPANRAHVREWTLEELTDFCKAAGFNIERAGHTRANQFDDQYSTIYIQLQCQPAQYLNFLREVGLLHDHVFPNHLLVTAEYAGLHSTGGIGSFVAEQRQTYGINNTLCLFVGPHEGLNDEMFKRHQLIIPQLLIDAIDLTLPGEDVVLKATLQLLFYFPNIGKIEYADYNGLGCRIAQAKRASLLPPSVELIVHCHGATHYLENANQTWYGSSHFNLAEREKISIECADKIVFPTNFLLDLYRDSGIEVSEEKVVRLRYPYHVEPVKVEQTEPIDTVVFFGKRSTMKGYSLFLGALAEDKANLRELGIKRIILIGPTVNDSEEDISRLSWLRSQCEVVELTSLNRDEAMEQLRKYANHAVCVMPYLGDNHPYALLDVTFAGVLPLMLRVGGVAELFTAPSDQLLLADPSEAALLRHMRSLIMMSNSKRHQLRLTFLESMVSAQQAINNAVVEFGKIKTTALLPASVGTATVIVPVFNTDLPLISDLIFGLNNQSLPPSEVIFIDDASEQEYSNKLKDQLQRELRLPYRVITHPVNKGLAGARNSGLNAVDTDYVINLDSDDVPLNDFVWNVVRLLDAEPRCAAAVPYLKAFSENVDFNQQVFGGYVYRPLGDGVIASQVDNNLGHANSGYRVSVVKALGGWDESEKSMWEDWALFLKIVSMGHKIGIIPQVDCLYRVRQQSMLRTYKVWPAMRRLARNMGGLPRFENFRLQAVMRNSIEQEKLLRSQIDRINSDFSRISAENRVLTAEMNRASVKAARSIVARLMRFPSAYAMVRKIGSVAWKSARWVRNIMFSK